MENKQERQTKKKTKDEVTFTGRELICLSDLAKSDFNPKKFHDTAVKSGFAPLEAAAAAASAVKKMGDNEQLREALGRHGVTVNKMALKLAELLDAQHAQYAGKPDNFIQMKAWSEAAKVMDGYPSTKIDINRSETVEIHISQEMIHRVEQVNKVKVVHAEPADNDNRP